MSFNPTIPTPQFAPTDVIDRASDFASFFADNGKPQTEWAVGVEVELFGFTRDTFERITPSQVETVVQGFASRIVNKTEESGYVTEATIESEGGEPVGRLTLEPGGQIEFSGTHRLSLREIERDLRSFLDQLRTDRAEPPYLLIGHRATWYALEHLLAGRELADAISTPWRWQPGWQYRAVFS